MSFLGNRNIEVFAGSSLWEIDTLRHHYCPPVSRYNSSLSFDIVCSLLTTLTSTSSFVARFVLSLENDLTVRSKTSEVAVKDFSSGSYATIFNEEVISKF